jgi:hypothetical protein
MSDAQLTQELLQMVTDAIGLTHMPDHAWEDSDYALRDQIAQRIVELEAQLAQQQPVTAPQPDWSKAPKKAMWWCVDAGGGAHWSVEEPVAGSWNWNSPSCMALWLRGQYDAGLITIPLGIDWRTLKQQRPAAQEAPDANHS